MENSQKTEMKHTLREQRRQLLCGTLALAGLAYVAPVLLTANEVLAAPDDNRGRGRRSRPSHSRGRRSRPSHAQGRRSRPSRRDDRRSRPSHRHDRRSRPSHGNDRRSRPSGNARRSRPSRP